MTTKASSAQCTALIRRRLTLLRPMSERIQSAAMPTRKGRSSFASSGSEIGSVMLSNGHEPHHRQEAGQCPRHRAGRVRPDVRRGGHGRRVHRRASRRERPRCEPEPRSCGGGHHLREPVARPRRPARLVRAAARRLGSDHRSGAVIDGGLPPGGRQVAPLLRQAEGCREEEGLQAEHHDEGQEHHDLVRPAADDAALGGAQLADDDADVAALLRRGGRQAPTESVVSADFWALARLAAASASWSSLAT